MFQADRQTDGRRSILIKSLRPGLSGPNKLESTSEDLILLVLSSTQVLDSINTKF